MTCSSKFLKYLLAVLAETPATYILIYCNASSSAFTDVPVAEEVIFGEEISRVSYVFVRRVINPKRLCFFQKHLTFTSLMYTASNSTADF